MFHKELEILVVKINVKNYMGKPKHQDSTHYDLLTGTSSFLSIEFDTPTLNAPRAA